MSGVKWLTQCSREARFIVNGRVLCTQHARIDRKQLAAERRWWRSLARMKAAERRTGDR